VHDGPWSLLCDGDIERNIQQETYFSIQCVYASGSIFSHKKYIASSVIILISRARIEALPIGNMYVRNNKNYSQYL